MTNKEIYKEPLGFSETERSAEHVWLEEAQRRYKELKSGLVTTVPASEVIAKAKVRLNNINKIFRFARNDK